MSYTFLYAALHFIFRRFWGICFGKSGVFFGLCLAKNAAPWAAIVEIKLFTYVLYKF